MQIRLRAFASLREALGYTEKLLQLPEGTDVASLVARLAAEHPEADLPARRFTVAINRVYVARERVLVDGDEVALIPPVSGGSFRLFEVTERPISLDDVAARVITPERGGIALFAGTVRGVTGEQGTEHLEYEAYPEMAEASFATIAAEAQARWPALAAVAIVHRIGRLEVGDVAVGIAVAAAHRVDIFDACRYIIDRIKQIAPVWKKEYGVDGSLWVEGPESQI